MGHICYENHERRLFKSWADVSVEKGLNIVTKKINI